jgi:hypothetical protein
VGSRVAAVGAIAAIALVMAGCTSGEEPSGEDPPSPTGSTPTGQTSPTTSPSPSVTPATGPRIDAEVAYYNLPEREWSLGREGQSASYYDEKGYSWDISSGPALAIGRNLDRMARTSREQASNLYVGVERLPDREVAGVEGYVLEGANEKGSRGKGLFYEFGTIHGDYIIDIEFDFPEDSPRAREWIESVLASWQWK